MKDQQTILDVRTAEEFSFGNVPGSINIPMQEITMRLDEIRAMPQPIVLCCASGNRSGHVMLFLQNNGINCENGGSWVNVIQNLQTA
ncbi:MAG: rhodanese-like domain-containing protein [Ferruginibacter sp.]